ncbi:transglutaminase-like domain-containing protein [Algoriphagus boritolerans]|uniref:Transglutaminase-like superfamily protein n=1 Tax=Algoriphagus boritolerans DSM 17298 = JCM 18970 TaxID=1120964 RepID=A0A1H6AC98_9BACT|nr:transglutaminase domain-containing protein [Algoriphagus boritolerans]SEG46002.1 Transglutaminase-like superfamily protein [Algoriphagus boritolerans DSM 17298 = JCM 18970]
MLKVLLAIFLFTENYLPEDTTSVQKEVSSFSTLTQKQTLTINSDYTYTLVDERKLFITSPSGLKHATTILGYDQLNEVNSFELEIKDGLTGKSLKRARLKDMGDAPYISSFSVFEDFRYKFYEVTAVKYPIEVTVRSEVSSKTNFFLPVWLPTPHSNQKVTQSSFAVNYPTELGLKYKEINLSSEKSETVANGMTTLTWSGKNLAAYAIRPDSKLVLAPVKFKLDQYQGEMTDWSELAAWQYELNKGRDVLPEDFKAKVLAMVEGVEEPYEKVKILYSYLQKNFRYVSIQLGIGGWQTMTAADVVNNAYGDCKALTNLMKAMLETVGIASNYTLVRAGSDAKEIELDFPAPQFNHVILQVPTDGNPIWLECTSNVLPAGFLGEFTRDRHVLVTKEGGGFLTKTPAYNTEGWNLIQSQSKVSIDLQGNATITSNQQLYGNFSESMLWVKNKLDERGQRDFLNRTSAISGLIVRNYTIEILKLDSLPKSEITYEGVVQKFTQATAKRVVLKSFLGKLTPDHLANKSLKLVDQYEIELPEAWQPDGNFPEVNLKEDNLSGILTVSLEGKMLKVRREISIHLPEKLEKEQETELLRKINTAFDRTILLSKSTLSSTLSPSL